MSLFTRDVFTICIGLSLCMEKSRFCECHKIMSLFVGDLFPIAQGVTKFSCILFYIIRNMFRKKSVLLSVLKGHHIDSVGWNWQNANENTTGAILLGTSKG